ncbi:MAG TPA: phosphoribosylaminoimidazolesuccinocarboxamide synthase [Bryobacteraceae bacterium]|nr:phosphoribosylaminoimidazolesuccinocarboxamide synthase [Bryobacteraceae bacterium]
MPKTSVITKTDLPGIELKARGKVRDVYSVPDKMLGDPLLFIATDRISAFDCVLPQGIPDKGRVLTQMSLFWFELLKDVAPNHLITANVDEYPAPLHAYRDQLEGRSMLVKRCQMEPVECVARGYVVGSGWKDYKKTGAICGIPLPAGLKECQQLPEPIYTPSTKAETGHDENISFEETVKLVGKERATTLRDLTLKVYSTAAKHAASRGIILADTKFEFGWHDGKLLLADEVLTPDSSRYWPADSYEPGKAQPSFDKQFVRDYLETLDWNKQPPAPPLPEDVIAKTSDKYREAYKRITGRDLQV